ncbi:hypothetical protein JD844_005037, partial [Phrynosoma platyrhinos]
MPILMFQNKTDTKFVKVLASFPAMLAVSACAHIQWDQRTTEISTVFSYAVPAFINEFQLRGFVDEDGFVRFALILHGHHSPYFPVFRADRRWHHFCITWQQRNGTWAIYADGKEKASSAGLSASHAIGGHGTFIIGQDQDSLGGAFKEKESFSGNLTSLQIWQRVLSREQVEKVRSCVPITEGLVFGWSRDILEVEATVKQAVVQLTCPGPMEECQVLEVTHGSISSIPCLQPQPFICRYQKDLYFQLKEMQSQSVPPLIAQVNMRANATVIPANIFQADIQGLNISSAARILKVVDTVLSDAEPPPLDAGSLLGVFRLLKEVSVSSMEVEEPEQLGTLEQLGWHYVKALQSDTPSSASTGEEMPALVPFSGLNQITLTNTWYRYGSLQRLSTDSSAVFEDAAVSDGGRRYLSTQVSSSIISSSLVSDYEEISTSVLYSLRHQTQALPDQLVVPICAFWNFSRSLEGGNGGWSTAGCSVVNSHPEFTACSCNHTTNFAVLLQVYEVQKYMPSCSVPKSERTTVHKNLIFALAAAEALLMFSELAKTNQGVCFAVTAFLHLFFMAAFAWMLVEGLLLWSKVVAVNMSEDRRMRFYYITGWGLPIVIVGVTLATSFNKYVADNHCWLNVQTDIIWAFVGPVLFVLTPPNNLLPEATAPCFSVITSGPASIVESLSASIVEFLLGSILESMATAKPVLVLLPVLGLTWVCGVLVHLSITWAYIFIVLNSLQGLYIFLVYAIYNSEVRNAIQRMKEKKKALSFTNCSRPINYLSSPRNTSWEMGKCNPSTPENSALPAFAKDVTAKNIGHKGTAWMEENMEFRGQNSNGAFGNHVAKQAGCATDSIQILRFMSGAAPGNAFHSTSVQEFLLEDKKREETPAPPFSSSSRPGIKWAGLFADARAAKLLFDVTQQRDNVRKDGRTQSTISPGIDLFFHHGRGLSPEPCDADLKRGGASVQKQ